MHTRFRTVERLPNWAHRVMQDIGVLYLAVRSAAVPWYAKSLAALTVSYALNPIDLIPDFIPVLGYVDDLLVVPFGFRWLRT